MLQSPYFFFDVVYLHNGMEDQGDETSWRVSGEADGARVLIDNTIVTWHAVVEKSLPGVFDVFD